MKIFSTFRWLSRGLGALSLVALIAGLPAERALGSPDDASGHGDVLHVLLVSVDGMHQSDLAWYVRTHPGSTLAALVAAGLEFSNAMTPFPSDSFPGMVGQLTGGNPSSTGIYYDDTWNHAVFPAQKLPTSRTEGDLSGTAPGGYLADGVTPGPVLGNALDFVDRSLGKMVSALKARGLFESTAIIVSAKHGQSPMNIAALNRIRDGQIIDALNAAWNHHHQGDDPNATPLVAQGTDDDGMLLWLNDRSTAATDYARQFLLNYNDPTASVDGKPVTSAGLSQIFAGAAAAQFMASSPPIHGCPT
jgi:hypothetical protein